MTLNLAEIAALSEDELIERGLKDPEWLDGVLNSFSAGVEQYMQECNLASYTPANPDAIQVHQSRAREICVVGGNRSSKTDTSLAELSIQATGLVPTALKGIYPTEKLRPPIRARVICNSLTDTLLPVILPKLRWDQWNGVGEPSSGRGHWGWIPKHCLRNGKWEDSYQEKTRTLNVAVDSYWNDSKGIAYNRAYSQIQFMSYDQDLSSFVGSSQHLIIHDELPPESIYRESKMRVLDVKGTLITAFTPPDEAGASRRDVSYFFDEVYEKGLPGPDKHKDVETIVLHTERNRVLDAEAIADLESRLTAAQREVRLHGRFVHLSGVIFDEFTSHGRWWCYRCQRFVVPVGNTCGHCTSDDIGEVNHVVEPFTIPKNWPVVFVIDPHPRKGDAMVWFALSPDDTAYAIAEAEVSGTAEDIKREIDAIERSGGWYVAQRIGDPNILTQTEDKMQRGWTMQRAYGEVGLNLALANDEMNAGIAKVRDLLRPDKRLRQPYIKIFTTCNRTIKAMTRWSWDDWKTNEDRELKERPREKHKDFADCVRYFAMGNYTYSRLKDGPTIFRRSRG